MTTAFRSVTSCRLIDMYQRLGVTVFFHFLSKELIYNIVLKNTIKHFYSLLQKSLHT
jgi:hypothetical protein